MEPYILSDREFWLFRDLIYELTGIALTETKRQLVQSRLQKRLRHYGLTRFQDYYDLVMTQGKKSEEITALINCVTTNKTDFFREPHHFDFVMNKILPAKIQSAARGEIPRVIRVWHAGCSTGEEPYTLAMVLTEGLAHAGHWDVKLLATDIDTGVLEHAEAGIYTEERVETVPVMYRTKYFMRGKGDNANLFKIRKDLRDMITFRRFDLREQPWPMKAGVSFDIVFCRNVVIYFDKPTQQQLFKRFAEKVKPGGYFFAGHSESLLGLASSFDSLGGTIFNRRMQAGADMAA